MRDIDAEFATVIVTRHGEAFDDPRSLARQRLALGSRDSGRGSDSAALLPQSGGSSSSNGIRARSLRHRHR
jgi:hypothetical protein